MNEVTKIHLGRQAFTVSVDAHKALQKYLRDIEHESSKDVVDEVEMRMAELLTERGIGADKVVIGEDVTYLKAQLGEPDDFKEDGDESTKSSDNIIDPKAPKRLFRDTEHGMVAGVAAGLAAYIGIDKVVVRLLFVLAVITGGWGIFVYFIFWLIMPEAKTKSEQLQMKGMAVTVDSLKELVDRADVPGAAERVSNIVSRVVKACAKVVLGIVGVSFVVAGIAASIWTVIVGMYALLHGGQVSDAIIFPIGSQDMLLLACGVVTGLLLSALLCMLGVTLIRRKRTLRGWVLGVLGGLFFLTASVGTALAFDSVPRFQAKYRALEQTQTIAQPAFSSVMLSGEHAHFSYKQADAYAVEVRYFGKERKESPVTTSVTNNVLAIEATDPKSTCTFLCLNSGNELEVIIHAPLLNGVMLEGNGTSFGVDKPLSQPAFSLTVSDFNTFASVAMVDTAAMHIETEAPEGFRKVVLTTKPGQAAAQTNWVSVDGETISSDFVPEVTFKTQRSCAAYESLVYLSSSPQTLTVNDRKVGAAADLAKLHNNDAVNAYNCIDIRDTNGSW